jgi:hypothetical protein
MNKIFTSSELLKMNAKKDSDYQYRLVHDLGSCLFCQIFTGNEKIGFTYLREYKFYK